MRGGFTSPFSNVLTRKMLFFGLVVISSRVAYCNEVERLVEIIMYCFGIQESDELVQNAGFCEKGVASGPHFRPCWYKR